MCVEYATKCVCVCILAIPCSANSAVCDQGAPKKVAIAHRQNRVIYPGSSHPATLPLDSTPVTCPSATPDTNEALKPKHKWKHKCRNTCKLGPRFKIQLHGGFKRHLYSFVKVVLYFCFHLKFHMFCKGVRQRLIQRQPGG